MGFNQSQGRRHFATISDGKLVLNHQNPIEGVTETRINKNGKQVHEQFFKSYTGMIKNITSKETSFGFVWELTLTDEGEEVVISWNYSSRYTNNFFRVLPNIMLDLPITFAPWSMKDKNDPTKKVIGLSVYQDINGKNQKVPFKWDRDNPGDMPDLKKTEKKKAGKPIVEWDDSDQLDFFQKYLTENVLPIIAGRSIAAPSPVSDEAPF